VHRELQAAFAKAAAGGLTQQQLAEKLEVNRATINKRLLGQENLTLRTIADLAWALDYEPQFKLVTKPQRSDRANDTNVEFEPKQLPAATPVRVVSYGNSASFAAGAHR